MSIIINAILGNKKLIIVEEKIIELDLLPGAIIPKPDQEFESLDDLKAFMEGKLQGEESYKKYL